MDYTLRELANLVMAEVEQGGAVDLAILDCLEKAYALGEDSGYEDGVASCQATHEEEED